MIKRQERKPSTKIKAFCFVNDYILNSFFAELGSPSLPPAPPRPSASQPTFSPDPLHGSPGTRARARARARACASARARARTKTKTQTTSVKCFLCFIGCFWLFLGVFSDFCWACFGDFHVLGGSVDSHLGVILGVTSTFQKNIDQIFKKLSTKISAFRKSPEIPFGCSAGKNGDKRFIMCLHWPSTGG